MKIKLFLKALVTALTIILVFVLSIAFPFGPLLPWSPVKPGYNSVSYASGDIFFNKAEAMPGDYQELDRMIEEAEAFHHLKFHRRVKVIACKNWADCDRGIPWLNMHGLGGVTLGTGDVIYITPKLREKNFSIREFLRHELSHALLSQNTTILKSNKLNRLPWFFEGLAVSFGRQKDYFSRQEFLAMAAKVDLAKFIDPAKVDISSPEWNARFAYPAQRYFVEYLWRKFGEERFAEFLRNCIDDPDLHAKWFEQRFGESLGDAIGVYQQAVRSSEWPPLE